MSFWKTFPLIYCRPSRRHIVAHMEKLANITRCYQFHNRAWSSAMYNCLTVFHITTCSHVTLYYCSWELKDICFMSPLFEYYFDVLKSEKHVAFTKLPSKENPNIQHNNSIELLGNLIMRRSHTWNPTRIS